MKSKQENETPNFAGGEFPESTLQPYQLKAIIDQKEPLPRSMKKKVAEFEVANKKGLEELCLYDGIKLRNYDQDFIRDLISEKQVLFDLKPTLASLGGKPISYKGKYENLLIKIFLSEKQLWILQISGSVHKVFNIWSNNGRQNYNDFYWKEFLQVYEELVRVFEFNPKEMEVVNLEAGINCVIPNCIGLTTAEIIENIISVLGVCQYTSWIKEPGEDFYKVKRGERYLKFYDKAIQNGLLQQIVRLELGYDRSRRIVKDCGAKSFFDLTKPETSILLRDCLIKAFETLHTFHPDLRNIPLHEIEEDRDVLKFSMPSFWCKLRKENRYQHDKKREKHELLIDKYCRCNLAKAIVEMLIKKLQ